MQGFVVSDEPDESMMTNVSRNFFEIVMSYEWLADRVLVKTSYYLLFAEASKLGYISWDVFLFRRIACE